MSPVIVSYRTTWGEKREKMCIYAHLESSSAELYTRHKIGRVIYILMIVLLP